MKIRICRPVGLGGEDVEDVLLADLVGVYQDVIKDEDLGFVGREFLGDGETEAEEELFFGALRKLVEGVGCVASAANAGNLEMFIEEDFAVGHAGEFGEGRCKALFQGNEHRLGGDLFAVFYEVVGDARAPALGARGGALFALGEFF